MTGFFHFQVQLDADFALQRHSYRLKSIDSSKYGRSNSMRWLHYRLDFEVCTVPGLVRLQSFDCIQQTGIGLVEVRIRNEHGRTVLTRTDVLQSLEGMVFLSVVAFVVRIVGAVTERVFGYFVQIGGETCNMI